MATTATTGVEANLLELFQTLGIERTHIAAGGPPIVTDWHGSATGHPERVAPLILPFPPLLDTAELRGVPPACSSWQEIRVRARKVPPN